jgi:hypothetical protein
MGYSYVNIGRDNMYMDSCISIYDCWVCPKNEGGRVGECSIYSRWNNFGNQINIGVGIWGGLLGQDFVAVT